MATIDALTGATWKRERAMYVRYHRLTDIQADNVMSCMTHTERENLCEQYRQENNGKGN